jgi:hypothetical protein
LSEDICAICGYGPADVRGKARHTAMPAVDMISDLLQNPPPK